MIIHANALEFYPVSPIENYNVSSAGLAVPDAANCVFFTQYVNVPSRRRLYILP